MRYSSTRFKGSPDLLMAEKTTNKMRSVRRCFKMMELFDEEQKPISASQIARELDAPLSSTIDLMKCVGDLGYMSFDSRSRQYLPTSKIARLGSWLIQNPINLVDHEKIIEEIHGRTDETVGVFSQNGSEMKCIAAAIGDNPIAYNLRPDTSYSLFGSAVGTALLAQWEDSDIENSINKHNAKRRKNLVDLKKVMRGVTGARKLGYAKGYNLVISGIGAIAAALPIMDQQWMVFSIGGPTKRVRDNETKIAEILLKALSL